MDVNNHLLTRLRQPLVRQMILITMLMGLTLFFAKTSFAQNSPITQENFSQNMSKAQQSCEAKNPYPAAVQINANANANNNDTQVCNRLVVRGKRMECEINQFSQQLANAGLLTKEPQPEVKAWNQCVGRIAILLQEGFYISANEIDRRQTFCNNQFLHNAGAPPKQGFYEQMLKKLARNDLSAVEKTPYDRSLFDRSSIRIDEAKAGLQQCNYMVNTSNDKSVTAPPPEPVAPPVIATLPEKKSTEKSTVRKAPPPKETAKAKPVPAPVKPENPVGECRRPKRDCPY